MFIIILIIGIIIRIAFYIRSVFCLPISTDEAYVGLMAKHILKGEFPLVYWGTGYQGPIESYINVPLFYFFHLSPISMRFLTLIWSILFMVLIYKFSEDIYGKKAGLLSMLFIAIPPPYIALAGSLAISPYNYTILIFGTSMLFITYKLVYKGKKEIFYFSILGFLSGLMFWAHMIVIYYLLTILIIFFLKDKLFFIKKGFLFGLFCFLIGSLPLWIYNFTHNFESFALTSPTGLSEVVGRLKFLFKFTLPAILGFHPPLYIDTSHFIHLPKFLGISLWIVYGALLIYILFLCRRNIFRLLKLTLKGSDGTVVLLIFLFITFIIFSRTQRANWWGLRYLEPIYSAVPLLLAYAIFNLNKRFCILSIIFASIILFSYLYSDLKIFKIWGDKRIVEEKLELPSSKELIGFLKSEGITHAYAHYWPAYRLTFETDEDIIVSPAYDERFGRYHPRFLKDVEASSNMAYIFQKGLGISSDLFEEKLKMIGGEYKKRGLGYFTVFYSFKSPHKDLLPREIPRDGWRLESNFKSEDVNYVIDNDIITRWGTGSPQSSGMYFLIDLGKTYEICKIRFDLGRFGSDYPRIYQIEVSLDGETWNNILGPIDNVGLGLFWEGNQPRLLVGNYFNAIFKPVSSRFVKITQLGSDPRLDWSIAEIYVCGTLI